MADEGEHMPLDPRWIDRIFDKLAMVYGQRFYAQWSGMDPAEIKADWAHELAGVSAEGVNHALHNLPPDYPVNVLQFKALCARRPDRAPVQAKLAGPLDRKPAGLTERMNALKARMQTPKTGLDWAKRLQQLQAEGEQLTPAQQDALRAVRYRLAGSVPDDDGNDDSRGPD